MKDQDEMDLDEACHPISNELVSADPVDDDDDQLVSADRFSHESFEQVRLSSPSLYYYCS